MENHFFKIHLESECDETKIEFVVESSDFEGAMDLARYWRVANLCNSSEFRIVKCFRID